MLTSNLLKQIYFYAAQDLSLTITGSYGEEDPRFSILGSYASGDPQLISGSLSIRKPQSQVPTHQWTITSTPLVSLHYRTPITFCRSWKKFLSTHVSRMVVGGGGALVTQAKLVGCLPGWPTLTLSSIGPGPAGQLRPTMKTRVPSVKLASSLIRLLSSACGGPQCGKLAGCMISCPSDLQAGQG